MRAPSVRDLLVVGTLTAYVVATGNLVVGLLVAALLRVVSADSLRERFGRGEQL